MAKPKSDVPDGLNEEYYQVNQDILGSFNKFRPPLDLFRLKEDVVRLLPYYKVGGRLTTQQAEELPELTKQGLIFVSRKDHAVYVKHISYQLDLVLIDKNLHEREIADIFTQALTRRMEEFLDQPVKPVFEKLYADLMVLTEYLIFDIHRVRALLRRLHKEHSLAKHSFNCGVAGLALYGFINSNNFEEGGVKRTFFDRLTLGLFLHDMGMSKVPKFILDKDKPLTTDERNKILQHPMHGVEMLAKLDIKHPELEQCVLEHHERLTGSGYPQKKNADNITQIGRICGLVDSWCAMTTKRVYAEAMEPMAALRALMEDSGYDRQLGQQMQLMLVERMKH
ncbi:HD-GYP domain-containing protein [Paucidesulfovibrio longus]|uniref:HD-GYP domain-containing protein n=1 Tax=Paucidesulfovibrio longus TaxID=889 RepID=UPI0003B7835F|nr:HD domain-containing phosphohydrolase [Paucidesulfovibrio longus]